jgi:hypothetical protein
MSPNGRIRKANREIFTLLCGFPFYWRNLFYCIRKRCGHMRSAQEQRLFRRIIALTFLFGLVSGLWGLLMGIKAYNFIQSGFDLWGPMIFSWPLDALRLILNGTFLFLLLEVTGWWSRFLASPQQLNGRSASPRFWIYFLKVFSFLLIGEGSVALLVTPLKLSPSQGLGVAIFQILLLPLAIISPILYYVIRRKRYSRQQRASEEVVKNPAM